MAITPQSGRAPSVQACERPPPKMRDLVPVPELETAGIRPQERRLWFQYQRAARRARGRVRRRVLQPLQLAPRLSDVGGTPKRFTQSTYSQAPPPRQISNTSTTATGSENWETYDDSSEPEVDAFGHVLRQDASRERKARLPGSRSCKGAAQRGQAATRTRRLGPRGPDCDGWCLRKPRRVWGRVGRRGAVLMSLPMGARWRPSL